MLYAGELDREQFLAKRKEASLAHITAFFATIGQIRGLHSPSGAMGKAISYIECYKSSLTTYLESVEATPSHTVCERVAKSFATGKIGCSLSPSTGQMPLPSTTPS